MADIDHKEGECLHCFLRRAVKDWARETGRSDADGMTDADPEVISAGVGALIADLMAQSPTNQTAGAFYMMVIKDASVAYPYYRRHYRAVAEQEQLLAQAEPRGRPN